MPLVSKVRLAGFCDAGNVWDDPYEFELDSLAIGAGLGLRFDIALFPLRLDYTWPVQKDDPETETRRFSFSIGYGF
jgi:outer membrane protein assembly factor BamA